MPEPSEPTQRLFFALWPDPNVRNQVETFSRRQIRKQAKRVSAANLHITLAFPGSVAPPVRDCLEAAAGRIIASPFELAIDRVGYWSRPRIIWMGPSHTPAGLWVLVKALRRALDACGLTPETRPYQPHFTLARKAGRGLTVTETGPVPWSIRDFCLVESVTDPSGVRYQLLRRWALEG